MRPTGKVANDKGKGLFGPDDWNCRNCHNVNWARRSVCNVCNTPRVNTLGQRTGYGGGFMERDEVVEYKHRIRGSGENSDDEFDEFGRKKKRFRKTSASGTTGSMELPNGDQDESHSDASEPASPSVAGKSNDDEEESGDDGDLSKYDIWGEDEKEELKDGSNARPQSQKQLPLSDSSNSSSSGSDSESSSASSTSSESRRRLPRTRSASSSSSSSISSSPEDPKEDVSRTAQTRSDSGSSGQRTRNGRDRSRSPL